MITILVKLLCHRFPTMCNQYCLFSIEENDILWYGYIALKSSRRLVKVKYTSYVSLCVVWTLLFRVCSMTLDYLHFECHTKAVFCLKLQDLTIVWLFLKPIFNEEEWLSMLKSMYCIAWFDNWLEVFFCFSSLSNLFWDVF